MNEYPGGQSRAGESNKTARMVAGPKRFTIELNLHHYKRRSRATINELPTFILSTTEGST
jgi:hypothetical protein